MQTTRILITTNRALNGVTRALKCVSTDSSIEKDIAFIVASEEQYDDFVQACVQNGVVFQVDPLVLVDIIAA